MENKNSDTILSESHTRKLIEDMQERQKDASESEVINSIEERLREVAGESTILAKIHPPKNRLDIKTSETRIHLLIEHLGEIHDIKVEYEKDTTDGPHPHGDYYRISENA